METTEQRHIKNRLDTIDPVVFEQVNLQRLSKIVLLAYNVRMGTDIVLGEIVTRCRKRKYSEPRFMIMLIASYFRHDMKLRLSQIGLFFRLDHASVCHAWVVTPVLITQDRTLASVFDDVEETLIRIGRKTKRINHLRKLQSA